MASKLQIEVEVDSSGALKGFKLVEDAAKKTADSTKSLADVRSEKFGDNVKNFIENPLQAAGQAAKGLLSALGPVGTAAAGIGVAVGAIAVAGAAAARDLGALGDSIGDTAVRMGLTVREVGEFRFAMKYAGGDIGALEGTIRRLSQALDDGSSEGAKAREAMREMGIATRTSSGQMKPMSEIILGLSDGFNKIGDTAQRNAKAIQILGRAGLEVLPDLLELSAGVQRAKQLGLGPSDQDIQRWSGYQQKMAEVDTLWESLKRHVKEPLAATVIFTYKFFTQGGGGAGSGNQAGLGANLTSPTNPLGAFGALGATREFTASGTFMAPRGSGLDLFERQLADFQKRNEAAAKALGQSVDKSLEGAQSKLERLKEDYDKARNAAEALAQSGSALPIVAEEHRKKIIETRAAYESQKATVRELEKAESARLDMTKKIREEVLKIRESYSTSDVLKILTAQQRVREEDTYKYASASQRQQIDAELNVALFRQLTKGAREAGDKAIEEFIATIERGNAIALAIGDEIKKGVEAAGDPLNTMARAISRTAPVLPGPPSLSIEQRQQSLEAYASAQERIIELSAGPGGEVAAIQRIADLRRSVAAQELVLSRQKAALIDDEFERNRELYDAQFGYEQKLYQIQVDNQTRLLELRKRGADEYAQTTQRAFEALISGGRGGFESFLKSQLTGVASTIAGNVARLTYQPGRLSLPGVGTAENPTLLGKILTNTPFGADPAKAATDLNTRATTENTMATVALTRALAFTPSAGGGGYAGGGSSGMFGALSGIVGGPGGTGGFAGPVGAMGQVPEIWMPYSTGALGKAPNLYGIPGLTDRSVNIPGLPTTTLSSFIGSAAGIGFGAASIASGVNRGGFGGALGIAGGGLSAAGGILSLLGMAAPALGPIGAILGLGSMLFGMAAPNPKQQRAEAINAELESARYTAPESMTYSMDLSGRSFDYDYRGTARVVNNITNNISAIDSKSFAETVKNNGIAIADTVDEQLMSHGPLQQRVRSTALPM